jgi:uncharacterized coiled-coil protein SlyX
LLFAKSEEGRAEIEYRLGQLSDTLERMTERMEATAPSATAFARIADTQERLIDVLTHKTENEGLDAESRMRLRSIDVQMLRILEEVAAGRQETMAELRTDLNAIARALDRMARNSGRKTDKSEG